MSLINDALKRASETSKQSNSIPATAMQAAEHPRSSAAPLVLALILVVVLSAAGLFFWKWQKSSATPVPITVTATPPVQPSPAVEPPVASKQPEIVPNQSAALPLAQFQPTAPAPESVAPAQALGVPANPPAQATVAPIQPVAPSFPELKLQGIFFNSAKPTAMINGRPVSVGTKVKGARIVKIEPEAVTIEWNGEQRVLEIDK